jgi:hypothetical protein
LQSVWGKWLQLKQLLSHWPEQRRGFAEFLHGKDFSGSGVFWKIILSRNSAS